MTNQYTVAAILTLLASVAQCAHGADDAVQRAGPENVLVVYNSGNEADCRIAEYYRLRRGVPAENMLALPLKGWERGTNWKNFYSGILTPVRQKLLTGLDDGSLLRDRILYIMTTPGMPRAMTTGHQRNENPIRFGTSAGWRSVDQWLISIDENFLAGVDTKAPGPAPPPYRLAHVKIGKTSLSGIKLGKDRASGIWIDFDRLGDLAYVTPGKFGDLAIEGGRLGDYEITLPDKKKILLGDLPVGTDEAPMRLGDVDLVEQALGAAGSHVRMRGITGAFTTGPATSFKALRHSNPKLSGVYLVTRLGFDEGSAMRAVDGAIYAERYLKGSPEGPELSFWLDQKFAFAGDQVAAQVRCSTLVHPSQKGFKPGAPGPLAPWPLVIDNEKAEIGLKTEAGAAHMPTVKAKIAAVKGKILALVPARVNRRPSPTSIYFAAGTEIKSGDAAAKVVAVDAKRNLIAVTDATGFKKGAEITTVWPGTYPAKDVFYFFGFYGLGKYEDVFAFPPGAIGIHVDSACNKWATGAMRRGMAATYGVCCEPFSSGIPYGDIVLGALARGNDVAEAFSSSIIFGQRWAGTIYGDPIYAPFRGEKIADVVKPVIATVDAASEKDGVRVTASLGGKSADELADVVLWRIEYGTGDKFDQSSDYYTWPEPGNPGKVEGRRYSGYTRTVSRVLTGLEAGKSYTFRIIARDPAGNEATSGKGSFTWEKQ